MRTYASNIQIVDGHVLVRHSIALMLEDELGIKVCCQASTVEEALLQQQTCSLHLVITDINLPGHSGLELIQKTRASFPDLPILVLTMHDEKLYAERVLKAGAQGYIMKQEENRKDFSKPYVI